MNAFDGTAGTGAGVVLPLPPPFNEAFFLHPLLFSDFASHQGLNWPADTVFRASFFQLDA